MLPIELLYSYFCFSEMGWLHPHGAQSGVPGGSAEDEGAAGLSTRLLFSWNKTKTRSQKKLILSTGEDPVLFDSFRLLRNC